MRRSPMSRFAGTCMFVLVVFASNVPVPLRAQTLHAGSRVRVWSSAPLIDGRVTTIASVRGDTVVFRDNPSGEELTVANTALTRVDLSVRRGSPIVGTVGGVLVGMIVGVAAGIAPVIGNCPDLGCGPILSTSVPLGFLLGAMVGGVV